MESGTIDEVYHNQWKTISLSNTYQSMVVVATLFLPSESIKPAPIRIRNAYGNSFEIMVQQQKTPPNDTFTVNYMVLEAGVYDAANFGITMEALRSESWITASKEDFSPETRSLFNSYSNPVVVGQVLTYRNTDWTAFWASNTTRTGPPAGTSFAAGKHIGEDPDMERLAEEIGYVVVEAGTYQQINQRFIAGVGAATVEGVTNALGTGGYQYTLSGIDSISTAVLSMANMVGIDGGWPVFYGPTPIDDTTMTMAIDEDIKGDTERVHSEEQVAYIAFETTGTPYDVCTDPPAGLLSSGSFSSPSPTDTQNYIQSVTHRAPTASATITPHRDWVDIAYFDGLGRPIQSRMVQASPLAKDVVQIQVYDEYGRAPIAYLPFNSSGSAGAFETVSAPATTVDNFYATLGLEGSTSNAYAVSQFEPSPLNRVLEQGAPGTTWQPESNSIGSQSTDERAIVNVYLTNSVSLPGFDPDSFYYHSNYYPDSTLRITHTWDENHFLTELAQDQMGRTVYSSNQVSGTDTTSPPLNANFATTFYIYDRFGNVKYVLQPEGWKEVRTAGTLSTLTLDNLAFQYEYDARQRVIRKRVPAAGWMEMVYDKLDRVVATRDGNLAAINQWMVTKYDALGRPVLTGLATDSNRATLQTAVDGNTTLFETLTGSTYSNSLHPVIDNIHSSTYYDHYDFLSSSLFDYDADFTQGMTIAPNIQDHTVHGRVTGVRIKVLNPEADMDTLLLTVTYYDVFGREIQTIADNHWGNREIVSSSYNFAGELLETLHLHNVASDNQPEVKIRKAFTYDHRGRLLRLEQQVDNNPVVILAEHRYDEIGQLVEKNLHAVSCESFLQSIDYTYNIRGWLKKINQLSADGATAGTTPLGKSTGDTQDDLFGLHLFYNEGLGVLSGDARYNGNISGMLYQNGKDSLTQGYGFSYDGINRLKEANNAQLLSGYTLSTLGVDRYSVKSLTYDLNGNIQSFIRYGKNGAGPHDFGIMDQLTYTYANSGKSNVLASISEGGYNAFQADLDQFVQRSGNYDYDANGNLTEDPNKAIDYAYNHLNKPTSATQAADSLITWVYAADGTKLRQITLQGTDTTVFDYLGTFFYIASELKHFQHPEGRVLVEGSTYPHEYHLTDHLGNIRVSFSDTDYNGVIDTNEVLQTDHYYPFGMRLGGLSYSAGTENRYRYNGKELHRELGLGWYDYGARMYDAAIGRWNGVDPLAEIMAERSPFNYVFNNPMRFIDPDGMMPSDSVKLKPAPEKDGSADAGTLDEVVITAKRAKGEKNGQNRSHRVATTLLGPVPSGSKARGRKISSFAVQDMVQAPAMQGVLDLSYDMLTSTLFAIQLSMGGTGMAPVNQMALKTTLRSFPTAKMVNLRVINAARSSANLLKAANAPSKGGLTAVGRALQKHGSRQGSLFPKATGNAASINAQGETVLKNIVNNPNATTVTRHHARFGNIMEIKIPNGQGARFSADGKTFHGFIE